jgi:hypothetical protein
MRFRPTENFTQGIFAAEFACLRVRNLSDRNVNFAAMTSGSANVDHDVCTGREMQQHDINRVEPAQTPARVRGFHLTLRAEQRLHGSSKSRQVERLFNKLEGAERFALCRDLSRNRRADHERSRIGTRVSHFLEKIR